MFTVNFLRRLVENINNKSVKRGKKEVRKISFSSDKSAVRNPYFQNRNTFFDCFWKKQDFCRLQRGKKSHATSELGKNKVRNKNKIFFSCYWRAERVHANKKSTLLVFFPKSFLMLWIKIFKRTLRFSIVAPQCTEREKRRGEWKKNLF